MVRRPLSVVSVVHVCSADGHLPGLLTSRRVESLELGTSSLSIFDFRLFDFLSSNVLSYHKDSGLVGAKYISFHQHSGTLLHFDPPLTAIIRIMHQKSAIDQGGVASRGLLQAILINYHNFQSHDGFP